MKSQTLVGPDNPSGGLQTTRSESHLGCSIPYLARQYYAGGQAKEQMGVCVDFRDLNKVYPKDFYHLPISTN